MSSISVHLRQCRNLVSGLQYPKKSLPLFKFHIPQSSSRGDKFTCFARVEHGSRELGVGEKAECVSGEVLAVELVLGVPCGSEAELGEVAQNPLLGEWAGLVMNVCDDLYHTCAFALVAYFAVFLLHTGRCYDAETSAILLLLNWTCFCVIHVLQSFGEATASSKISKGLRPGVLFGGPKKKCWKM